MTWIGSAQQIPIKDEVIVLEMNDTMKSKANETCCTFGMPWMSSHTER